MHARYDNDISRIATHRGRIIKKSANRPSDSNTSDRVAPDCRRMTALFRPGTTTWPVNNVTIGFVLSASARTVRDGVR